MKKILCIFTFFLTSICVCQNIDFQIINKDNIASFPSNTIYDITEDQNGFIVFLTNEGLVKYNGLQCDIITPENTTISTIGSNFIKDGQNSIWFCSFNGALLNFKNNKLIYDKKLNLDEYKNYNITNGILTYFKNNSIFQYDIKHKSIKKTILFSEIIYPNYIATINNVLYLFQNGIDYYKIYNNQKYYYKISNPKAFKNPFYFESKGDIFIFDKGAINQTLYKFDFKKNKLTPVITRLSTINFGRIYDNSIWLTSLNGVFEFDLKKHNLKKHLFKNQMVYCIFKDKQGVFWLGTKNKGIYCIKNFKSIAYNSFNSSFSSIENYNNDVFIGTIEGKMLQLDTLKRKLCLLPIQSKSEIIYFNFSHPNYNFISSNGLNITDKKFNLIKKYNFSTKDINFFEKNKIILANTGFIGKLDLNTTTFPEKIDELLVNLRSRSCLNFDNNSMLFSTNKGTLLYKNKKISEVFYKNERIFSKQLIKHQNAILILDEQNNSYKLDKNGLQKLNSIKVALNKLKIYNNKCYGLSHNAIYQIDLQKSKILNEIFYSHTKINDFCINGTKLYVLFNNKISEITNFSENITKPNNKSFFLSNIVVNNKSIQKFKNLKLEPTDNTIEINFEINGINYNPYIEYKINDTDWQTLSNSVNNLKFSNLKSGEYNILFREKNTNQVEKINFEIGKYWWENPIFFIIASILTILLVFFLIKRNHNKLNYKNKLIIEKLDLENKLNLNKLKLIKAQMNPHFFFNALNTIQSYITTNEPENASSYLNRFSTLTRKILEMTEKEWIQIDQEIEMQKLYLELQKLRLTDFDFEINSNSPDVWSYYIPTMLLQPYVENAIIHGLSNKIGEKKLHLLFHKQDDSVLKIMIIDNGIGIKKSNEINKRTNRLKKSFATNANLERISISNLTYFKIDIKTTELTNPKTLNSIGTKVELTLQIKKEDEI